MDSTLKSNLSVGLPLDMVLYEVNRYESDKIVCIDEGNPYFRMLHDRWGAELRKAFDTIESPQWDAGAPACASPLHAPGCRYQPLRKTSGPLDR